MRSQPAGAVAVFAVGLESVAGQVSLAQARWLLPHFRMPSASHSALACAC